MSNTFQVYISAFRAGITNRTKAGTSKAGERCTVKHITAKPKGTPRTPTGHHMVGHKRFVEIIDATPKGTPRTRRKSDGVVAKGLAAPG